MATTSIPQLLAYSETAGFAGYRGLATAGPPLVAWGLVTGSPLMNCGVTSLTALMAKSDLDGEAYTAEFGEPAYVLLMAAYSLAIGVASIVLALIGFGKLAKSVPQPVRAGFKWGCAVGVLVSALPNGLFRQGGGELKQYVADSSIGQFVAPFKGSFPGAVNVAGFFYALFHPLLWGVAPALLFVLGTAFIMKGPRYLPKSFPPGTEVVILTAAATLFSMYGEYNAAIVGEIPTMDPDAGIAIGGLRIPVEFLDMKSLVAEVPLVERFGGSWLKLAVSATIFAGVNFLSIMGIVSAFESENGIPWSAERELVTQGVGNLVAAAVGSPPVSGSLSRSLVSRMTGTTSQLACIVTALCWIYLQPYMSIMTPTPKAALSAVIVSAVIQGIVVPKDLLQLRGWDAIAAWSTGLATATTSPTQGFGFGLVLYLILSVLRAPPKTKEE